MPVGLPGWLRESTMDEIIKEFVQESTENLDRLDQDFVSWKAIPVISNFSRLFSGPCIRSRAPVVFWEELAKQTATATEDISRKIETIQSDAKGAVAAIASISEVISHVNDISGTIATAVEQQSATTSEMSRNVSEAAKGSNDVAQNIHGVAQAAQSTSQGATDSQNAAK